MRWPRGYTRACRVRRTTMKTRKIFGMYIGEILFGTMVLAVFVAAMMLAVNSVCPAYQ